MRNDDGATIAELDKIERALRRINATTNGHDLERIRMALTELVHLGSETVAGDLESMLGLILDGE